MECERQHPCLVSKHVQVQVLSSAPVLRWKVKWLTASLVWKKLQVRILSAAPVCAGGARVDGHFICNEVCGGSNPLARASSTFEGCGVAVAEWHRHKVVALGTLVQIQSVTPEPSNEFSTVPLGGVWSPKPNWVSSILAAVATFFDN